jgi:ribosomal protein S18 acetylase RimI-like enzyme
MNLSLVKNNPEYYEFIRELRIHKDNLSGFLNQSIITKEEQIKYMEKYGESYYVALSDKTPVGFVGVIDDDIRVATHPNFKKQGVGKFMINEIMKIFPNCFAKIKHNNLSSIKLFESCGFEIEFLIMRKNELQKTN